MLSRSYYESKWRNRISALTAPYPFPCAAEVSAGCLQLPAICSSAFNGRFWTYCFIEMILAKIFDDLLNAEFTGISSLLPCWRLDHCVIHHSSFLTSPLPSWGSPWLPCCLRESFSFTHFPVPDFPSVLSKFFIASHLRRTSHVQRFESKASVL